MKIAILAERRPGETRVAASPDTVKKFKGLGLDVVVESGAGVGASIPDAAFEAAGATIAADATATLDGAEIVLKVQRPLTAGEGAVDEIALLKPGQTLIGMLEPWGGESVTAFAAAGITAFSMELVPRITRAQVMDVLSSQANLAGYRAVLEATAHYPRAFPMMMTAAGTVAAAKCFVMGAGVAGLQAIATARRLGAVISATDVRPATKEQVESLGASFIAVMDEEFAQAQTAGGYAKEMSAAYKEKQAALIAEHLKKQDVVITTALIPGRPAPKLITDAMLAAMKPGSVIVDIAAERGGNVEGCVPGQAVRIHGVTVVGAVNLPARIAADASLLYAKNLLAFLTPLVKDGKLVINREDEIVKGALLTLDGQIVHPTFQPAA